MKCQHCHKNEAVNTFLVAYPGGQQEIHLCEECTKIAQRYYEMAKQSNPGMFAGNSAATNRKVGSVPFPDNAGAEIRQRRQMNMLRARLEQAVENEHYEEAARLRDQIAAEEKDVYAI